jgi:mycothione reductase
METFDLIVIGSGAGLLVAEESAAHGLQVAMIESGPLGGTCLNRGCIPSKMLIRSADVMELARRADTWGVKLRVEGVDWPRIVARVAASLESDRQELGRRLREASIRLIANRARFVGQKVVEAGGERLTAEKIVIAAGSRPNLPELAGLDSVPYLTSDTAMSLENQPRSLIIVGGGDVAAELAHFFAGLGTDVTLVNRGKLLLPREDADVSAGKTRTCLQPLRRPASADST